MNQMKMSPKELYKKACGLVREIEMYEEMLDTLHDIIEPSTRPGAGDLSRGFSGNYTADTVGKHVAKHEEVFEDIRQVDRQINDLKEDQLSISNAISAVGAPIYRMLLFSRYVQLKPWDTIARDIGYTKRHITRLHVEAYSEMLEQS